MVSTEIINHIQQLAAASPQREICGVVDSTGVVHPIPNVSTVPTDFVFSRPGYGKVLKYLQAEGRTITCVYHSHLNGDPTPSAHDCRSMRACGLDYLIVAGTNHSYTRCTA